MKGLKRVVLGLLLLVIVAVVGVFVYLSANLNGLIVEAVETFGPKATQSRVVLDSADISLSGEGELNGLIIANPKGYKAENAFNLGSIKVAVDVESLTADVIRIKRIEVVAPELTYEPTGKAGSNLQQLVQNIQQFASSQGGGGKAGGGEKKMIIDRLSISSGTINIMTPLTDSPLSSPLPTIELTDIGKQKGGSTPADVAKLVMQKVTASATQVGNLSLSKLQDQLKGKVGELQDKLKAGSGAGLGGKAGEVGDQLKSLFK